MTKLKNLLILGTVILAAGATTLTAFAASNYSTPAEAVAGITGKTVDEILIEKQETNKTYGEISDEYGYLNEFKEEMLEIKKDILDKRVQAGLITEEESNKLLETIEENQLNCDGSGYGQGQNSGIGLGGMMGNGSGIGSGRGRNKGCGLGSGLGKNIKISN